MSPAAKLVIAAMRPGAEYSYHHFRNSLGWSESFASTQLQRMAARRQIVRSGSRRRYTYSLPGGVHSNALSDGVSGKRGFPVVAESCAAGEAVRTLQRFTPVSASGSDQANDSKHIVVLDGFRPFSLGPR